jgi:predicted dehydrogenase
MSSPFRAVVVGCGEISAWWFQALKGRPDVEIVGLVDLQEAAAAKRRQEMARPAVKIGTDVTAMLAELRPDLVFDCTIPAARASVVEAALRAGCHVLSEKPMANSMAEARRLIQVARESGRTFAIMQNRRYVPQIRSLRGFLARDPLGGLTTLNCDFYVGAHFAGYRGKMKHVLLLDMAVHSFDQARLISGAHPVSVYCREWNPRGSWFAHGAAANAIFEMSDGLIYNYRGSWCAEGQETTWECDWHVIGTEGHATWNGADKLEARRVVRRDAEHPAPEGELVRPMDPVPIPAVPFPGPDGHAGCIYHFLDCIRDGRVPETNCTDNIKSLAMVFGAIESAESGKLVAIEV